MNFIYEIFLKKKKNQKPGCRIIYKSVTVCYKNQKIKFV
jgi:hypothetical protein